MHPDHVRRPKAVGPLVAAALSNDDDHHACVELFTSLHLAGRSGSCRVRWSLRWAISSVARIALAERLQVSEVVTLDRRHFTVVRPRHVSALTLLP